MVVAFWSTNHGQTATTSNAIAISLMIALEYRIHLLLMHTHDHHSTMESSMLDSRFLTKEYTRLSDIGIDALMRSRHLQNLSNNHISNYTTTILKNRLDLLIGTTQKNEALFHQEVTQFIDTSLERLKECYDLILLDVPSGLKPLSQKIIRMADYVVVNLNQNIKVIESFLNMKNQLERSPTTLLFGMYDDQSKFNLQTIKRKYKFKSPMFMVPYCREFADACNEGKAVDFFLKNIEASKGDFHHFFIREIRQGVHLLLRQLGVPIDGKVVGE